MKNENQPTESGEEKEWSDVVYIKELQQRIKQLEESLEIAKQYVLAWSQRGEDPLVGENINAHISEIYKVLEQLGSVAPTDPEQEELWGELLRLVRYGEIGSNTIQNINEAKSNFHITRKAKD